MSSVVEAERVVERDYVRDDDGGQAAESRALALWREAHRIYVRDHRGRFAEVPGLGRSLITLDELRGDGGRSPLIVDVTPASTTDPRTRAQVDRFLARQSRGEGSVGSAPDASSSDGLRQEAQALRDRALGLEHEANRLRMQGSVSGAVAAATDLTETTGRPSPRGRRSAAGDMAATRDSALALIDAPDRETAQRLASGLKGQHLAAVEKALGVSPTGSVADRQRAVAERAIGSAFKSVALRQYDDTERDDFIREHRERARQRVLDNTGGATGVGVQSPDPFAVHDDAAARRAAKIDAAFDEPSETAVSQAYATVAGTRGGYVDVAKVRSALGTMSREEQDAAIKAMVRGRRAHVAPQDYQSTLTPEQRAAAFDFGGRANHLLMIEGTAPTPAPRGRAARLMSTVDTSTPDRQALAKKKVPELQAMARERGLRGLSKANKARLVDAIADHDASQLGDRSALRSRFDPVVPARGSALDASRMAIAAGAVDVVASEERGGFIDAIRQIGTREEARSRLGQLRIGMLREIARSLDMPTGGNKAHLVELITERTVGARLNSQAIRQL